MDFENEIAIPLLTLPTYCPHIQSVSTPAEDQLFVGLSSSGRLYAASSINPRSLTLATNCSSFLVATRFVVYTTAAHYAHFASLAVLAGLLNTEDGQEAVALPEWEQRRVERGSRIVTVVPSTMSVVLQMPRGNLETINPRPLVLEVVKQDIDR